MYEQTFLTAEIKKLSPALGFPLKVALLMDIYADILEGCDNRIVENSTTRRDTIFKDARNKARDSIKCLDKLGLQGFDVAPVAMESFGEGLKKHRCGLAANVRALPNEERGDSTGVKDLLTMAAGKLKAFGFCDVDLP